MMLKFGIPVASLLFMTVSSFPVEFEDSPLHHPRPWEVRALHEGDILTNSQDNSIGYSVLRNKVQLWPRGVIHYRIAPSLESNRTLIESAMHHIENRTCIRFQERRNENAFIVILPDVGCYSHVGRTSYPQPVSLGDGCMKMGVILHELNHIIGFFHEHTRSDRDDFVEINWDNILEGYEGEFDKMMPFEHRLINKFDYDSVMMYGRLAFSKDTRSPTMRAIRPGIELLELSQKTKLSDSDVFRINELYNCNVV